MPIRWNLNLAMSKRRVRNKDLAAELDITENSVYRLRKADEMPRLTPQRLEGICAALNCQPGELLEWVPVHQPNFDPNLNQATSSAQRETVTEVDPVIVQQASQHFGAMSPYSLKRLVQYYHPVLALAWRGFAEYGPGAVVFTDLSDGPKLAYIEKEGLEDIDCLQAVEKNDPEASAVVLYYEDSDYSTSDYNVLILTGPKSPPECFALSYKP